MLPVQDHLSLICSQYLARALQPNNPSHNLATSPFGIFRVFSFQLIIDILVNLTNIPCWFSRLSRLSLDVTNIKGKVGILPSHQLLWFLASITSTRNSNPDGSPSTATCSVTTRPHWTYMKLCKIMKSWIFFPQSYRKSSCYHWLAEYQLFAL